VDDVSCALPLFAKEELTADGAKEQSEVSCLRKNTGSRMRMSSNHT
jgi:hypothetical protein